MRVVQGMLDLKYKEEINEIACSKEKIKTTLNTISLFSGAGGLDLGLIMAGFKIVLGK